MESKSKPLVSVIVPSYNHKKYIRACIESIFSQTYKNIELIVIDDGSTDGSPEIIKKLSETYGFVFIMNKNIGLAATLNLAINEYSNGVYISICASDDYWLAEKIKKQVDYMESHRFYPMCFGKTHYVNENSEIIVGMDKHNEKLKGGMIFDDVILFNIHPPVNYMFRKEIFDELGGYDIRMAAEDYYMNLLILDKYPIGFIDEYMGFYRINETRRKVDSYDKVSESHELTIGAYKSHKLYNRAMSRIYSRRFATYSGYIKYKLNSLKYMVKGSRMLFTKVYLYGLFALVFKWLK